MRWLSTVAVTDDDAAPDTTTEQKLPAITHGNAFRVPITIDRGWRGDAATPLLTERRSLKVSPPGSETLSLLFGKESLMRLLLLSKRL
jgi:hypothetical protein